MIENIQIVNQANISCELKVPKRDFRSYFVSLTPNGI